ncbi:flagellar hook-associated protein FlgK [Ammoniphilus oxalaticus]|uniref:Flagellar hook-associated protein 1 n=1 Tax=Ammoniphilus oxalaticus TaxID=66863 RepID=A0A419SJU4_9BACL|nr:flagellar hook-associated protein FlgK [Ammoniphilus oxalaticus]RKD24242.1 flagellar hook-associated protein FlgK [Ammoniphilus oxalaticus]
MSTFHGLEIGKRSLFAQQAALSTTGHNIANSNTLGYTRQRVELEAARSIHYPGMNSDRSPQQMGTGVSPAQIVRIREDYLDLQFRNENTASGYWETMSDVYMKMEGILAEPSNTGLQAVMDQFWQGWQELAKDPNSSAARKVVEERGVTVADTFNHIAKSLTRLETDLENVMKTKVKEVNSLAEQISELNDQIGRLVPHGHIPNDLYDKRDLLIDQLSKLVDVEVKPASIPGIPPDKHGMITVSLGGQTLVDPSDNPKFNELVYSETSGFTLDGGIPALISGELMGIVEGKDAVNSTLKDINSLATGIANAVNTKIGNGPDFFSGGDAISIEVKRDSLDGINFDEGNPNLAQRIADLKFEDIDELGTTFDDDYRQIISGLGIRSQQASRMANNSDVLLNQIDLQRQSVSGVSLDEEMVNMIRYQQAYNAAARFVTTIDEVLDRVVNGMGRVGL